MLYKYCRKRRRTLMTNFVIVDETGKVYGEEPDFGNAAELWMVLEEMTGKKLTIREETLEMAG